MAFSIKKKERKIAYEQQS